MPGPAQIHAVLRRVIPCESPSDVISPRIASAVFTVIPIVSASSVEERTGALPARQFTRLFPDPAIRFHGSRSVRPGPIPVPRIPVPHGRDRLVRRPQDANEVQRQFRTGRVGVLVSIQHNARKQFALEGPDALACMNGRTTRSMRRPRPSACDTASSCRSQPTFVPRLREMPAGPWQPFTAPTGDSPRLRRGGCTTRWLRFITRPVVRSFLTAALATS